MKLEIIKPDERLFDGEASSVQLPGSDGLFEILDNHAALIATLAKGEVKVGSEKFAINGGVVEVNNNKVIVLAE